MSFPPRREKLKVAIVGSGMAGLTAAYLLNRDQRQRYAVTVFESVRYPSPFRRLSTDNRSRVPRLLLIRRRCLFTTRH